MSVSIPLHLCADLVPGLASHMAGACLRSWLYALVCKTFRTKYADELGWRPAPPLFVRIRGCVLVVDGAVLDPDNMGPSVYAAHVIRWLRAPGTCRFAAGALFGYYDTLTRCFWVVRSLQGGTSFKDERIWQHRGEPQCVASDGCRVAAAFLEPAETTYLSVLETSVAVYNWRTSAHWTRQLPHASPKNIVVNHDCVACHFVSPDNVSSIIAVDLSPLQAPNLLRLLREKRQSFLAYDMLLVGPILVIHPRGTSCNYLYNVRSGRSLTVYDVCIRPTPLPGSGVQIFSDGLVYSGEGVRLGTSSMEAVANDMRVLVPWAPLKSPAVKTVLA